jgi:hypothetical protein
MVDHQDDSETGDLAPAERKSDKKNDGPGSGERVTVNLNPRAARALELVTSLTGDTKTEAISRALQVYAFFEETTVNGGTVYVREGKDGALQIVKIF